MARIDIDKITKIDKSIRRHDFVRATYSVAQVDEDSSVFQIDTYSGPEDGHITQTFQFDTNNLSKLLKLISSNFESFSIPLLDDKGNVKYGLNWGNRNGRNINQAYLDLPVEIYQSDFFPTNGTKFVIRTDDNVNIIFTRAQKDNVYGHALQTPDDNTIIGKYIRKRLSLKPGEIITKEAIEKYGRNFITISKIGDFYYLDFSSSRKDRRVQINQCLPLQQIYYGAPGTGKSNKIKEQEGSFAEVYRTTFHPDSDYSTFVGCYKPTKNKGFVYGPQGPIKAENGELIEEEKITYSFSAQAFTKAYIEAWEKYTSDDENKNILLVIEEINRGNCAQIFGDLFQLLDRREDGFSDYPIDADQDLQKYIAENGELAVSEVLDCNGKDISEEINSGKKLMLPPNLYIWATMNTSDQSLFPIDSAFKRRWDWVYMPIADAKKNYVIEIDNNQYDWWSFLTTINIIIESTTHSEDKKLGYFFAKAKNGKITADTFVGKIIFYLWNDVFKDNESNHKAFKDSNGNMLAFHKFFQDEGSVNTNVVINFLQDLEVYPFEVPDDGTAAPSTMVPNAKRQRDFSQYSVNDKEGLNKAQMTREAFKLYIDAHPEADAQTISQTWNGLGLNNVVPHLVETEEEYNTRTKDSLDSNKRATEFNLSNGEKIYLSTQFGIGNIDKFKDAVNNAGWNIRIAKQA